MMLMLQIAVLVLVGLLTFVTLAPLVPTDQWWVRGWDFPRAHIAVLCIVAALLSILVLPGYGPVLAVACLGMGLFQGLRVLPFTPLWPEEIALTKGDDTGAFTLLSSNVLKENQRPELVLKHLRDADADVVLLMETDPDWAARLEPVLARYPIVKQLPKSGHYGMIFATRLEVITARFEHLSSDDTPTLVATLEGPNGHRFSFIGLHPRPPVPGQDTQERDIQIRNAARVAHHLRHPVIAMGDFNDVAWSDTSRAFKRHGGYVDPRVGRGIHPSFDADSWIMRFPIDQFFVTAGVEVFSFGRGPYVGSDHFPMHAKVRISDMSTDNPEP